MGRQFKKDHILIVDDFAHMRMSIKRMLTELGEENILFATSGEEAIKLMRREHFDIVLCDYNLGEGQDGQQVLEESRITKILDPSVIFIMITAEASIPYVLGALEFQPNDYLTKPFTKDLMLRRINKAIDRETEIQDVRQAVKMGDFDDAISICKQRLSKNSKYIQTYARLLGEIYLDGEMFKEAVSFFTAILGRNNFHWAMLGMGKAQFAIGEYAAAANSFTELLNENKYYIEGYDWHAKCLAAMGKLQAAQQILQEGVDLSPKSVSRLKELGKVAKANDELDLAGRAFRMAIEYGKHSCQKSADEYIDYSDVLREQGKPHKALLMLKQARQTLKHQSNDEIRVSAGLVKIHMSQNHLIDAKSELKRARMIYEKNTIDISSASALSLAQAAISTGDKEAEAQIIDIMVKNNHDDAGFIEQISDLLSEGQVNIDVKSMIDSSVEKMSKINARGVQLVDEGKHEEALELFEKAAEEAPNNRSFNLNAAQVMITLMQEHGENEAMKYKARRYLERVSESDQSDGRHKELVSRYKKIFGKKSLSIT